MTTLYAGSSMKVDSFWRCTGSAGVCGKNAETANLQDELTGALVVIVYNGEQVSVPKEVADFLEQDRKREQAQEKQDARHLSKSEFETVLSGSDCVRRPVEGAALRNLRLENLRGAIAKLDVQGQNLLSLRYSGELTMEEIGQIYGISRMAVSKRLKKLHKKLGSSVS
jgi:RNA polymerase sigma factor (sigma-70 family)